jgi:hypothetical protein
MITMRANSAALASPGVSQTYVSCTTWSRPMWFPHTPSLYLFQHPKA